MAKFTGAYLAWDIILRILGIGTSAALVICGLWCFEICNNTVLRDYTTSALVIIGGFVLFTAELGHWLKKSQKLKFLVSKILYFLKFRTGRSFFYVLAGGLALSTVPWQQAVGSFAIIVGIINLVSTIWLHTKGKKVLKEQQQKKLQANDGMQESLTANAS